MSDEGERTCPLCTEEMDLTDQQLKPCKCGYEICVWCWHHLIDMAEKEDTEGRCPACRVPYDKQKIVGMAASCERMVAEISSERKLKSQKVKPKASEGRKHLSSVRVIQRNLVYIIGIPSNLADEDILQRKEYFGQYGKVLKVSITWPPSGSQHSSNNTVSVYITYTKEEEAIRCIQSVHGFILEGKSLRACFGTTKYCHTWLRNMACTNPDCLYLHEIGTQEDSFTKDEIISAYTRSRVQQITGASYNLQRSGNELPPPADEFCNSTTASSGKVVVKSDSNNPVTQVKTSYPDGSSGRSLVLPAAASWGMRVSNSRPPASSTVCMQGPSKQRLDSFSGSSDPSMVASTTLPSALHSDVGKQSMENEENCAMLWNARSRSFESSNFVREFQTTVSDIPSEEIQESACATVSYTNDSSLSSPRDNYRGITVLSKVTNSEDHDRESCISGTDKVALGCMTVNGSTESLCHGVSSMSVNSDLGIKDTDVSNNHGSVSSDLSIRSPGNSSLLQYNAEHENELTILPPTSEGVCVSRALSAWNSEVQTQVLPIAGSEMEDFLQDDETHQVFKSYLPYSHHPLKCSNHSSSLYWNHIDSGSTRHPVNPRALDSKEEASIPAAVCGSMLSNRFKENTFSSSAELEKIFECSDMFSNVDKVRNVGRFNVNVSDVGKTVGVDMGESSIISDILSMDFDTWDDSLASPQSVAKLLSETDKQHDSLKLSSSWKLQNNNQSRFSFARQEGFVNQPSHIESSYTPIGHLQKKCFTPLDSVEKWDPYEKKLQNGFTSSRLDDSDALINCHSVISANKVVVSRGQISAPPGFSIPSRAPPPGFSTQERMDQAFDATPLGNHLFQNSSLLRNQYQISQNGNVGSPSDVEFIDPAILAVGKGRLPLGINDLGLETRSFSSQRSASENDLRLQLLMQQPISTHQNLRSLGHIGDRFSPFSDACIPSRFVDQGQSSNLYPFEQMSLQQSRNSQISNGQWDGWSELQTVNGLGMAEVMRNERLGLDRYIPGYEELTYHMPSSGDLYNRAFGM